MQMQGQGDDAADVISKSREDNDLYFQPHGTQHSKSYFYSNSQELYEDFKDDTEVKEKGNITALHLCHVHNHDRVRIVYLNSCNENLIFGFQTGYVSALQAAEEARTNLP